MERHLQKPNNPYSPDWPEYARQNPGLRRSLSAADAGGDYSFVPEQFKAEDGTYATDKFREEFDSLASFKAQADESSDALPKDTAGYEFTLPDDYALPEGVDPDLLATQDSEGNKVEFDPKTLINPEDPDLPLLQQALLDAKADPALTGKLASILAGRELRNVVSQHETAKQEKAALGPNGQSRIDTVKRTIAAKLPDAQAKAVMDTISSADALKGMEALLKASTQPVNPAPGKQNIADMSIDDRIMLGLQQQSA